MRVVAGIIAFMSVVMIAVIIIIGEWVKRRKKREISLEKDIFDL